MLATVNNLTHGHVHLGLSTGVYDFSAGTYRAQVDIIQALLLRAIGKVLLREDSLTSEQKQQVVEISFNHIVLSVLSPSYVAPGA
jgi:hypothetical protein